MKNKCAYYPCHNTVDNCIFCFCIIYPCKMLFTGGKMILDKVRNKSIWDCSNCTIVHNKQFIKQQKLLFRHSIKTFYGETNGNTSSSPRNK